MKRVTKEDLRSLYAPMSDEARQRSDALLQSLVRNERKEYAMKKKLFAGVALAMAMLLTTATALAASGVWDVRSFFTELFEAPMQERMESHITEVARQGEANHTVLTITAAYWDGCNLAFDWQVENKVPEEPVYLWMSDFTCNGVRINTDGTDEFNEQWLPGMFQVNMMQGGDNIRVPESAYGAEGHVHMTVEVWKPIDPVWNMEELDEEKYRQKTAEGFYVITGGEGFTGDVEEDGETVFTQYFGGAPLDKERFTCETITFDFTLDSRGEQEQTLTPIQSRYETEQFTLEVLSVKKTALEISVDFRVFPTESGIDAWALTNLEGNALPQGEKLPDRLSSCMQEGRGIRQDGVKGMEWHASWPNYNEALADGLAISYRADEQEMLFPILHFDNQ